VKGWVFSPEGKRVLLELENPSLMSTKEYILFS